jgi:AmmeMemoRadiSam system protein B
MIERGAIRPSALAGRWYPSDAATLRAAVGRYLDVRHAIGHVAFVVAPHAGIMYSGPTAGHAWAVVPAARRIVMVGPAHRVAFSGVALGDYAAYRIPGAEVEVDRDALAALEAALPSLARFNRDALARRQMTMQGTSEGSAEAYLTYAAQVTERVTPQRRLDPKPGVPV